MLKNGATLPCPLVTTNMVMEGKLILSGERKMQIIDDVL